MPVAGYGIALAREQQLGALAGIERAAAEAFALEDLPESQRDEVTDLEELAAAQRDGRLWVASDARGEPVGFAIVFRLAQSAHLDELAVHPAHQRRGLGRALVRAVALWARAVGASRLTLTTFRFVAWNLPWYERLGFVALPEAALSHELAEIFEREIATGLPRERRVAMALDLATGLRA